MTHIKNNSGKEERYTPYHIIRAARKVMGSIDLDPASCNTANEVVLADVYYTKEDNGLSLPWRGNVWMNPPYTNGVVGQFVDKLMLEIDNGNIQQSIVLVNNATETKWGQMLLRKSDAICFPSKRLKFLDVGLEPTGCPLQGQMIVYFGENHDSFHLAFEDIGVVI
jgi:ParB family transcriptional regulator, chromosome partitioning protein